jgi:pimeloyl-ACP methyl ester carboxylesterase
MPILCVAGKGGITGIENDPLFGKPSPIDDLYMHVIESIHGIRSNLVNWNDMPDQSMLAPDKPGEPIVLIGHSFGVDLCIALASQIPRLADANGWTIGDIALVLIDGVDTSYWWTPWRPRFEIPACVKYVQCFVRRAFTPPFSSEMSGADGVNKVNVHMPAETHDSIVAAAEPAIVPFVTRIFGTEGIA